MNERSLRILVADDSEGTLVVARAVIERMGHGALVARDGEEAVRMFREEAPDLALVDIVMPGVDGVEAVRRMRALPALRWVQIVFITAADEPDHAVRGLEAGGDDFLTKPLDTRILESKIRAAERFIELQQRGAQHSVELAEYFAAAEEEKRFARRIMDRLASAARMNDPAVHAWISPAAHLSGDVVAAARTPDGRLHVLLADGTGHGLAAALNALPIVEPFYAMTAKGFSPATILAELNHKLNTLLPTGCFVAAALAHVDAAEQRVEVWNAGLPEVWLIDDDGGLLRSFPSTELPLGVLPRERFDAKLEACHYDRTCQLMLCSDGLIEAENGAGECFGSEAVRGILAAVPPAQRYERLRAGTTDHLHGEAAHDDISFVLVDCALDPGAAALAAPPRAAPKAPAGNWRAGLTLDAAALRQVDVVPMLISMTRTLRAGQEAPGALFVVLSELVTNAIDHGLLALETTIKDEPDGFDRYLELRAQRLERLEKGEVSVVVECRDGEIQVTVSDSGPGFDVQAVLGRDAGQRRGGRGLALVASMSSSLEFRGTGNAVVARLA